MSNYPTFKPTPYYAESSVIVEEEGQRKKVFQKVLQDPEPFKDYTSHDFEIQTLIETGNIVNVSRIAPQPGELLDAIDTSVNTYNNNIEAINK